MLCNRPLSSESITQDDSCLVDITAGDDFRGLCDQKSDYKHTSEFGRLYGVKCSFNSRKRPRVNRASQDCAASHKLAGDVIKLVVYLLRRKRHCCHVSRLASMAVVEVYIERRQLGKGVGSKSDIPNSACHSCTYFILGASGYVHCAIYVFTCRVYRYGLCVWFL